MKNLKRRCLSLKKSLRKIKSAGTCIPTGSTTKNTNETHQLPSDYTPPGELELEWLTPEQRKLVFFAFRKAIRRGGRVQDLDKIIRLVTAIPVKNQPVPSVPSVPYIYPGELEELTPKQQMLVVRWVRAGRLPCARLLRRKIPDPAKLARVCCLICRILLNR